MSLTVYRSSPQTTTPNAVPQVVDGFILTVGRTWFGRRCVRAQRGKRSEGWWRLTRSGLQQMQPLWIWSVPDLPDAVLVAMVHLLKNAT